MRVIAIYQRNSVRDVSPEAFTSFAVAIVIRLR